MTDIVERLLFRCPEKTCPGCLKCNADAADEIERLRLDCLNKDEEIKDVRADNERLQARLAEAELAASSWKREAELNEQAANESAGYAHRLAEAEILLEGWHDAYHADAGMEMLDDDTTTWLAGISIGAAKVPGMEPTDKVKP